MGRIATLKGTFLVPGVSKNGRKYTPENIGAAVRRMKKRLAEGQPIPMHASHMLNAQGDTRATAAHVTKVHQLADGSAAFEADVLDTAAGRDIRSLTVPSADGKQALKTVSIFGKWMSPTTTDEAGNVSADDLDVEGIDFTHRPGVEGAQIEDARAAEMALVGAGAIYESVEEVAFVDEPVTESTAEPRPSVLALLEAEMLHIFEDGICKTCLAEGGDAPGDGAKPYGNVPYADNGYQADKKKRYPIDTKDHVRAAWSYICKAKNAAKYSAKQLAAVKSKIKRAASKFGINIAKESDDLAGILEHLGSEFADILEAYASTNFDNGQGSVSVSAYTDEPADLPKVGAAVARAALAGLLKLDPDNDGDVDIDGGAAPPGDEDDDTECAGCEAALPSDALFCPQCGQSVPGAENAPADPTEEILPMSDFTAEQVKALLPAERAASLDTAKASYTAEEVTELMKPVAETAPATPDVATLLLEALAAKAAPVAEDELTKARRIVAEAEAAAANQPATLAAIKEMFDASEQKHADEIKAIREEAIEAVRRGPSRQGLITSAAKTLTDSAHESDPAKLAAMSADELHVELDKTLGTLLPQS